MLMQVRSAQVASFASTTLRVTKVAALAEWPSVDPDTTKSSGSARSRLTERRDLQRSHSDSQFERLRQALLRDDIDKALPLYRTLRDREALTAATTTENTIKSKESVAAEAETAAVEGACSLLLRVLHTSLRLTQTELHRLRFRGSASQKAELKVRSTTLLAACTEVADDIFFGRIHCRTWGLMHLLTAYLTANQPQAGAALWRRLVKEDSHCREIALSPRVVGSAIPLLHAAGEPLAEIEKVYEAACAREIELEGPTSSNLALAMVPVWLHHGRAPAALEIFERLISNQNSGLTTAGAQTLYNCVIGRCEELDAVAAILDTVFAGTAPFAIAIHPVEFSRFLQRFVQRTGNNMEAVLALWEKYVRQIPATEPEWRTIVVTKVLLDAAIEQYPVASPEAVALLRRLIKSYAVARSARGPGTEFVISLLLRFNNWCDREVTLSLADLFRIYDLRVGPTEARAVLMSFKGIEVEPALIRKYWDIIETPLSSKRKSTCGADKKGSGANVALTSADIDALWKCTIQSDRPERIVFFEDIFRQALSAGPDRLPDAELIAFYKIINKKDYSRFALLEEILEQSNVVVNPKKGVVHRSVFAN
jgi:hypothetical protein